MSVVNSEAFGFWLAEVITPLEVRMFEGLLRSYSLFGVHPQHLLEKIEPLLVNFTEITAVD